MHRHSAIWVTEDGELSIQQIDTLTASSLSEKQYLVEVSYSGVNPADQKHAQVLKLGNRVAGYDAAGYIVASGPGGYLEPGTRVAVLSKTGLTENAERYGSHQKFLIAEEAGCFPLPDEVPMHVAATVPVVVATAADCLFSLLRLRPSFCDENRVPLLIWGGSSAVGNAAIQLAREAGVWPIIVTASSQHHAELMQRGATVCIDYKDNEVLEKIKASVQRLATGSPLRHAIDTTGYNVGELQSLCRSEVSPALACTVGGAHNIPKPFAAVIYGYDISLGKGITIPARPNDAPVVRAKVTWALDHLGVEFQQVPVTVVKGLVEAQECILRSAGGKVSFKKYAVDLSVN